MADADPQPCDAGEEGYLAFVMHSARRKAEAEEQEAAPCAAQQGEQGDARRD